jgi:hypothetical protein
MVACIIASTLKLGLYAILHNVLAAEARGSVTVENREAAQAIAAHLAASLEGAIVVGKDPTVKCVPDPSGRQTQLTCLVGPGRTSPRCIARRRYTWSRPDDSGKIEVRLQEITYAGSKVVTTDVPVEMENPDDLWANQPSRILGGNLDALTVEFRPIGQDAAWQSEFSGQPTGQIIRIRATSGQETIERVVQPQVTQELPLGH